jgi:hypothetical protein
MANWNNLPTEIKQMVANEIDLEDFDLLDFRATNVENNALSKKIFTERYFSVRRVFIREASLRVLVEISRDPFFGPCVKTVLLSALHGDYEIFCPFPGDPEERRPKYPNYHLTCYNDEPEELQPLLADAFRNFKTYGAPLEIGLDRCWGPAWDEDISHSRGMYAWLVEKESGPGYTAWNAAWADVAHNELDTFKMLTSAAEETDLPIKRLRISLFDHYAQYVVPQPDVYIYDIKNWKEPCNIQLVREIYSYLIKSPKMDVDIDLSTGEYRPDGYRSMKIIYDQRAKTLTLEDVDSWDVEDFVFPWLSTIQVRSLRLTNMKIEDSHHLEKLIGRNKRSIKKLRMKNCRLASDYVWELTVRFLSTMASLQYLNFVNPSVKYNWIYFFNYHFGNDKRKNLSYKGEVHKQLAYDLEAYKESGVEEDSADYPYMSADESGPEQNWDL